jgi:hypothetical protein
MVHSSRADRANDDGCAAEAHVQHCGSVHPHRESRRTIARLGFGVLEDGTTFPLSIVEISYSGCKIETQIALFPGVELRISALGGRATVAARVQWHREGCAGIEFLPDAPAARVKTPRAHDRRAVDASVMLRQTGRRHYQTQLFDLTPAGCKVEFVERPRPGDLLWAKFDGLEAIEATVAWVEGFRGGLKFARPIHPGIFDALMARLGSESAAVL